MPRFEISTQLLKLITEATELKAFVDHSLTNIVWMGKLQREVLCHLTHSSTNIEGNSLTLQEVTALSQGTEVIVANQARTEVTNCMKAIKWVTGQVPGTLISESHLMHLHFLTSWKLLPDHFLGHYRVDHIQNEKGELVHDYSLPKNPSQLTKELLAWIEVQTIKGLHPILLSAIAHHRLAAIHPFVDGDRRVARAVATWMLYSSGFDTKSVLAPDDFFMADKHMYIHNLQRGRELGDDLTFWLEYVAEGVIHALHAAKKRILALQVSEQSPTLVLTDRQEDMIKFLENRGPVKTKDIETAFGITRARVAQIMSPLVTAGLVIREGFTRATTYYLSYTFLPPAHG